MIACLLNAVMLYAMMFVASTIPAGTALPVMLNSTINARNAKPGEKIEGKVMQDVGASGEWVIKRGSRITGHIVSVTRGPAPILTFTFDELQDQDKPVPVSLTLRAIASMMSVGQAGMPINVGSDFSSQNDWVTKQVGGDVVNRGRGLVGAPGGAIVGKWTGDGVFGKLTPPLSGDCPLGAPDMVQSLWIFSTSACGAYDLPGVSIVRNGSSAPMGQIQVKFEKSTKIGGGSGWLLLVNGAAGAPTQHK